MNPTKPSFDMTILYSYRDECTLNTNMIVHWYLAVVSLTLVGVSMLFLWWRKRPKDMDFDGLFIVMVVLRNCQTPMGSLRAGTRVNNVKKRSYAYCSRSQHDNISSTYTKYTVVCALCSLPGRILSHARVGVRLHPCGWICEVNHPLNRHCSHHSQHNLCMGDLVCTDRNISETPPYSNMWHQCHQLKHCGISVQGFEYQYCLLYALVSNCCVPCEV